jgi:hypothetical protein
MLFFKIKNNIISTLTLLFLMSHLCFGQNSQQEYLESNPEKAQFNKQEWGSLKGKLKQESAGNANSSNNEDFNGNDFTPEEGNEGDNYDFEIEDYKGEYSEYQNYEDPENEDYEYDEEYDNYDAQENYYNRKDYDDGDYNTFEKKKESTPPSKPRRKNNRSSSSTNVSSGWIDFLTYLGYIVIIGVIIFIIYKLVLNYSGNEEGKAVELNFDEVPPSEIPKTELERRLEEALSKEDYREAVRIYFIFIIKDLSSKNWISWERKKTNMSYLMEMRNKPQFNLFNETVSIYDIVWYGNYTITRSNFNEVEPKFKKLLADIHS